MSKLGDVVFCVDCDRARSAQATAALGDLAGTPEALPRRMATKKDASGAALCAPCLDSRLQRRREEFLRPHGRSAYAEVQPTEPSTDGATVAKKPPAPPARKLSSVRIDRVRPAVKSTASQPLDRKGLISEILAEMQRAGGNASRAKALEAQMRSLQLLAAEIGFLRARELLAKIRAAALSVGEPSR